jgi:hypothetical protein
VSFETDEIDERLARIEGLLQGDAHWSGELARSAVEFFPAGGGAARDAQARRRHLEWFLLERSDAASPELAIEHVARRWPSETGLADPAALQSLLHSHTGVFEVTGVAPGEGMWLRDLASQGEYPVQDELAAKVIERGDLIAGRLFPIAGGLHRVSRAAAFHRDPQLLEALRKDLEAARANRRGVLRVGQRELEGLFWPAGRAAGPGDPVQAVRTLLSEAGIESEQIDSWLEDLARAPFDEDRLVHGARDELARILDRLAFETDVDLETARRALIHAWAELAQRGAGSGPTIQPARRADRTATETEVAAALERFEQGRRAGQPIAQLLDQLESELALAGDADEGDEATPDFPGVVLAVVEEFLWETGREHGPEAAERMSDLRGLGRAAQGVGVIENLGPRDLLAYAAWWLPEQGDLAGADDARRRLASLSAFCRWAEESQDLPLATAFGPTLARLATSLPRVAEANARRTRAAAPGDGELFEVLQTGGDSAVVRDRAGTEHVARVESALAEWLRPEDRLRGSVHSDGRLAVYCVYPPEVAGLAEGEPA